MKYKRRKALVVTTLLIGTLITSAFTFEDYVPIKEIVNQNQIVPYWDNAEKASLNLSLTGGKAECVLDIRGTNKTTKITADIRLYRVNSNGSYTSIESWRNITSYGDSLKVSRSSAITPGYTYRVEAHIEVYNGSNVEDISLHKEGYY